MSKSWIFLLFLLAVLPIFSGCAMEEQGEKRVWSNAMSADPDPYVAEYASLTSSKEPTLEDYWKHSLVMGQVYLARLDQAGPAAIMLQNQYRFSSVKEIVDFFDKENYGVCRHRAAIGYWLLQDLHPAAEIWLVSGLYDGPGAVWLDMPKQLDMNHVWVELNGEVVDFTGQRDGGYHPYVRVKIEGGPEIAPVLSEIEQQFQRDQRD